MQLLNEQFNSIYSEYNKTQLRNNRLLLERQKEIHARIPEIAELDRQISDWMDLEQVHPTWIKTLKQFPGKKLYFSHKMAIRKTTCSQFITVRTAGIPVILAMKNATVSADASSRISMNNLIFKTFLRPRIFLTLMKNTIQMTMLRIPPE